jgi:hypothetical protein
MRAPDLSIDAYATLRASVNATARVPMYRGNINMWTTSEPPSPAVQELLDQRLFVCLGEIRPGTVQYAATVDGMRVAGLRPSQIERCCALNGGRTIDG